jgi:hypothetical protein
MSFNYYDRRMKLTNLLFGRNTELFNVKRWHILCQMSLPIKPFSPREVVQEIKNINPHKADLITGKILRQLPRKTIVLLTAIYNSMLRMSYYPIM